MNDSKYEEKLENRIEKLESMMYALKDIAEQGSDKETLLKLQELVIIFAKDALK